MTSGANERKRFLESLGKVHDAVIGACRNCRLTRNLRHFTHGRFHCVTDEMTLRIVFVSPPSLEVRVEVFMGNLHDSDGAVFEENLPFDVDVDAFEFHLVRVG